ncbi:hypothetical protein B0A48_16669 [Cryoendolithus antarcticus]|uniref:F-box domain-containing protein n=1 Tax=Cryoendolithus antarcticus TaxID=1507870 RepID=A0A1V8SEE7_9PEZI|nr:hypothetical protein B0A48_16669 [Cryoendolithus antarcticus]
MPEAPVQQEVDARSPAIKTFAIPELLELILLFVDDTKTPLLAQRVDKNWHNQLNTSPKLRQALFFDHCEIDKHECAYNGTAPWSDCEGCCDNYLAHHNRLLLDFGFDNDDIDNPELRINPKALRPNSSALRMFGTAGLADHIHVDFSWRNRHEKLPSCGCTTLRWFAWSARETLGDFLAKVRQGCNAHWWECEMRTEETLAGCHCRRVWLAIGYEPAAPHGCFTRSGNVPSVQPAKEDLLSSRNLEGRHTS